MFPATSMIDGMQRDLDTRFPSAQVVITKFAQGPPANADVEIRLLGPSIETLQQPVEKLHHAET